MKKPPQFLGFFVVLLLVVTTVCIGASSKKKSKKPARRAAHHRVVKKAPALPPSPFARYKDVQPAAADLWSDAGVADPLRSVLGSDFKKFIQNMQELEPNQTLLDPKGNFTVRGGIPHLEALSATIFTLTPDGKAYAAFQDEGEKTVYHTNDPAYRAQLPPYFDAWRAKYSKTPVVYKSK